MPPPNMPLRHKDYFELKAIKNQHKKSSLPSPFLPTCRACISLSKEGLGFPHPPAPGWGKQLVFQETGSTPKWICVNQPYSKPLSLMSSTMNYFVTSPQLIHLWSPNPLHFVKRVYKLPSLTTSLSFTSFLWTPVHVNILTNLYSFSHFNRSLVS